MDEDVFCLNEKIIKLGERAQAFAICQREVDHGGRHLAIDSMDDGTIIRYTWGNNG